jgi:hypothetical protein
MLSTVLHMIGLCPDSLDHFNLASLANVQMTELSNFVSYLKLRLYKKL